MPSINTNLISDEQRTQLDSAYNNDITCISELINQQTSDITKIQFISYIMRCYIAKKNNSLESLQDIFDKLLDCIQQSEHFSNFLVESIIRIKENGKTRKVGVLKSLIYKKSKVSLLDFIIKKGVNVDIHSQNTKQLFEFVIACDINGALDALNILMKHQSSNANMLETEKYIVTTAARKRKFKILDAFLTKIENIDCAIQASMSYNKTETLKFLLNHEKLDKKHCIMETIKNMLVCTEQINNSVFCNIIVNSARCIEEILDIFTNRKYSFNDLFENNLLFLIKHDKYDILKNFINVSVIFDANSKTIRKAIKFAVQHHKSEIVNLFIENQPSNNESEKLLNYLIQNVIKNDQKTEEKIEQINTIIRNLDYVKYREKFLIKNIVTFKGKNYNILIYLLENNEIDILSYMLQGWCTSAHPKYAIVRKALDICIKNKQLEILKLIINNQSCTEEKEKVLNYLIQNIFANGITADAQEIFAMLLNNVPDESYIETFFIKNYFLIDNIKYPSLKYLVEQRNIEIIKDLINNGANIDANYKIIRESIELAANTNQYDLIELVIKKQPLYSTRLRLIGTLFKSIIMGNIVEDTSLLNILFLELNSEKDFFNKCSITVKNIKYNIFTYLAKHGNTKLLKLILQNGFDCNTKITEDIFHLAVSKNEIELCTLLIRFYFNKNSIIEKYISQLIKYDQIEICSKIIYEENDNIKKQKYCFVAIMSLITDDILLTKHNEFLQKIFDIIGEYKLRDILNIPYHFANMGEITIFQYCIQKQKQGAKLINQMILNGAQLTNKNHELLEFAYSCTSNDNILWLQYIINKAFNKQEYYKVKLLMHLKRNPYDQRKILSEIDNIIKNCKNNNQLENLKKLKDELIQIYIHNVAQQQAELNANSKLTPEEKGEAISQITSVISDNIKAIGHIYHKKSSLYSESPQTIERNINKVLQKILRLTSSSLLNIKTQNEIQLLKQKIQHQLSEINQSTEENALFHAADDDTNQNDEQCKRSYNQLTMFFKQMSLQGENTVDQSE